MDATESSTSWDMEASPQSGLHAIRSGKPFPPSASATDFSRSHRNVALKISVAHTSNEGQREARVLSALGTHQHGLPGNQLIVNELDTSHHRGPNGTHRVSVMELLGSSVQQVARDHFKDKRLPSSIAREVSKQTAQAISYLHELKIAHGDIHPGNLVFAVPELQTMPERSIIRTIGQPEIYRVRRSDLGPHEEGVPEFLVGPTEAAIIPNLSKAFSIKLVDFGNAFLEFDHPTSLSTPLHVRAPELALETSFDRRIDLWSLGCTIFTLFAGGAAFDGFSNRHLIADMIDKIGPLPQQWQHLYNTTSLDTDSDLFEFDDDAENYDFQQWLETLIFDESKTTDLTKLQVQKLGCLIRKLVQYQPAQRISAADLACNPTWDELIVTETWQQSLLRRLKIRQ